MQGNYKVITLCGSTKFKDDFLREQKRLTLAGNIVISVGLFGHSGDNEVWEQMDEGTLTKTKAMLDDIHKRKIDMADEIFVINKGGYVGASTKSEIEYAIAHHKNVEFMEPFTCQSCGMPLTKIEDIAHTADDHLDFDYCKYCLDHGKFINDVSMVEYIEMCSQFGAQAGMTNDEMRAFCTKLFPTLKRWKTR